MKKTALIIIFFLSFNLCNSQTINYPTVEKSDIPYLSIVKIELTTSKTTIFYKYISPDHLVYGGWVCIGKDVYIRDSYSKKVYKLIRANIIPICPEKHSFKYRGQVLEFSLEFEPLPSSVTKIDIIEDAKNKAFNFYGVNLKVIKKKSDYIQSYTLRLKNQAKMRKTDNPLSEVLYTLSKGQNIKVLSLNTGYYKVKYNGTIGYVNEMYFEYTDFPINKSSSSNFKKNITTKNCDDIKIISPSRKQSLNKYLSGIKTVIVVAHDFNDSRKNQVLEHHLFSSQSVMHQAIDGYLKGLGFNKIVYLSNFSDIVNYTTCDNISVHIVFGYNMLDKTPYSSFKMLFSNLCNDYNWSFESSRAAQSNVSSIMSVLKSMYNIRKPRFSSSSVMQLQKRQTCWTESKLKEKYITDGCKTIEGVYENAIRSSMGAKYKVAVKEIYGKYHLIYISGAPNPYNWKEGEIKAYLEKTSTHNLFKARWVMANKEINEDFYVSFENGKLNVMNPQSDKKLYIKLFPSSSAEVTNPDMSSSGSGFALTSTGYIATNYHIIKNASSIGIRGINGDFSKYYNAKIIFEDKNNDLAIVQINDPDFSNLGVIPYIFKSRVTDVGTSIFVLGYPLRATMGDEIKLTDGIVSSKSGFQGDITSYQISAPVQPGNSGGPLFDENGCLIGIINAKHTGAENATYAVKISYLLNLIDLLPNTLKFPSVNKLNGKSLSEQVKIAKKFTYIIEVN